MILYILVAAILTVGALCAWVIIRGGNGLNRIDYDDRLAALQEADRQHQELRRAYGME